MPANVSKLIAKLKRQYPELQDEPLVDELEMAAYGDEEDEPMDSAPLDAEAPGDDQEEEDEPADGEFSMPELEKEADLMSEEEIDANPGMPGKRKKRKPADDEQGDEPTDINGGF